MGTSSFAGDADAGTVPGARLAEEAKLLLDALAERAQPWLNRLATADEPADGAPHSPASCGWCPVCAGIALVRGERPELAVRAAEHAAGLLAVLRAALAEPGPTGAAGQSGSAGSTGAAGRSGDDSGPGDPTDEGAPRDDVPPTAESEPEADAASRRVRRIAVRRRTAGDESSQC